MGGDGLAIGEQTNGTDAEASGPARAAGPDVVVLTPGAAVPWAPFGAARWEGEPLHEGAPEPAAPAAARSGSGEATSAPPEVDMCFQRAAAAVRKGKGKGRGRGSISLAKPSLGADDVLSLKLCLADFSEKTEGVEAAAETQKTDATEHVQPTASNEISDVPEADDTKAGGPVEESPPQGTLSKDGPAKEVVDEPSREHIVTAEAGALIPEVDGSSVDVACAAIADGASDAPSGGLAVTADVDFPDPHPVVASSVEAKTLEQDGPEGVDSVDDLPVFSSEEEGPAAEEVRAPPSKKAKKLKKEKRKSVPQPSEPVTLETLPISKLKTLARYHGVNIKGCLEKTEIVSALRTAGVDNEAAKRVLADASVAAELAPESPPQAPEPIQPKEPPQSEDRPPEKSEAEKAKEAEELAAKRIAESGIRWSTWLGEVKPFVLGSDEPQTLPQGSNYQTFAMQYAAANGIQVSTACGADVCWDWKRGSCYKGFQCKWKHA